MKKVELKKVISTLEEIKEYDGKDYEVEYTNQDLPTEEREIRISFVDKIGNTDINKVVFMSLYRDSRLDKNANNYFPTFVKFYTLSTRIVIKGEVVATRLLEFNTLDNLKVKINNAKKGMF